MADPEKQSVPESKETEVSDNVSTEVDTTAEPKSTIAAALMKNPEMLAAVQGGLNSMIGMPSGYIASLPPEVKRRIKALKKLQSQAAEIEAKFYAEIHELEMKYIPLYEPLFNKRSEIVNGNIEPTDSDCEWSDEEEEEDEAAKITDDIKKLEVEDKGEKEEAKEPTKGVPFFWSTILKNVDMLSEMVQEHDEPIIQTLQDVKLKLTNEPMGFILEFHFGENEYFTNKVLTKEYIMRPGPDEEDPLGFEGPEIIKCVGCNIDWKKNKNVTVKLIKKVQKHKGRGVKRTITKTVQNDSFFNFFNPPDPPQEDDDEEDSQETEALLTADFELGHFIRERIIPKAVLYFTGDAIDDEYDDEDMEEEGEEGDDEDYDEDGDGDYVPKADGEKPADCKQQ